MQNQNIKENLPYLNAACSVILCAKELSGKRVTSGDQTFSGNKTFNDNVTVNKNLTVNKNVTVGGCLTAARMCSVFPLSKSVAGNNEYTLSNISGIMNYVPDLDNNRILKVSEIVPVGWKARISLPVWTVNNKQFNLRLNGANKFALGSNVAGQPKGSHFRCNVLTSNDFEYSSGDDKDGAKYNGGFIELEYMGNQNMLLTAVFDSAGDGSKGEAKFVTPS